jgi:hypothetical protein
MRGTFLVKANVVALSHPLAVPGSIRTLVGRKTWCTLGYCLGWALPFKSRGHVGPNTSFAVALYTAWL